MFCIYKNLRGPPKRFQLQGSIWSVERVFLLSRGFISSCSRVHSREHWCTLFLLIGFMFDMYLQFLGHKHRTCTWNPRSYTTKSSQNSATVVERCGQRVPCVTVMRVQDDVRGPLCQPLCMAQVLLQLTLSHAPVASKKLEDILNSWFPWVEGTFVFLLPVLYHPWR